jgi:cyclopropane fatty-acyl-phospholipid synthase-like methyltransferase
MLNRSADTQSNDKVIAAIRVEVLGTDIGQNSWLSVQELDRFASLLNLKANSHLLEACSGTGGTALYLASHYDCQVTGIDINASDIVDARRSASQRNLVQQAHFEAFDANQKLPFEEDRFDALLCVDSVNHLPHRASVLAEWYRVLKPGGRLLYSDPMVITGPISSEEIALGSPDSSAIFLPPGENERLVAEAGFRILRREDLTGNAETLARRWHASRQQHQAELARIEGETRLESLQHYYETVQRLAHERRLSRFAYLAEKPLPRIPGEIPSLSHPTSRTSGLPFGRLV